MAGSPADPGSEMEMGQIISQPPCATSAKSGNVSTSGNPAPSWLARSQGKFLFLKYWGKLQSCVFSAKPQQSKVRIHKVEDSPRGFPLVASFLDSDDQFMIYRRFGFLHARLLLNKQDELHEMEEDLRYMDERDANLDDDSRRCLMSRTKDEIRGVPDGWDSSRKELLEGIEKKIMEYGQIVLQAQQLVSMNRPAERDYTSFLNFFENRRPLFKDEQSFIYEKEDLVTLRPGPKHTFLDVFVERVVRICTWTPILGLFAPKETRAKTLDPNIHFYARRSISLAVNFLVTLLILGILVVVLLVPIWLLYHLNLTFGTNTTSLWILLGFTLVFSAVLSFFTEAKRHEILTAAAAYCAVLVVFVSNVSSSANNQPVPQ